jgi:hypothetical protein
LYRVVAAACLAAGLFLAFHHPLAPGVLAVGTVLWAATVWRWPFAWLLVVPALLPVLNFLPWTGWVVFDEFDVLLLATAAGGHARLASIGNEGRSWPLPTRLISLLVLSSVVACIRGVVDAGGLDFDWFGGYRSSMNSLRVFKSLFFTVLLMPLMVDAFRRDAERAGRLLATGIAAGLALVALGVVRERAIHPGLLDFSTPYRCVSMFWEMHVGGAALDGYLVLSIPFAAWALLESHRRVRWLGAALLVVVAGYACLTTFSRGMYLAVAIGLATLAWLRLRPDGAVHEAGVLPKKARLVFAIVFLVLAQGAFSVAGYRGALVLLVAVAIAMAANMLRSRPWWPARLRTQGSMVVAMILMVETLAVVNGGSFLLERLAKGNQDFGSRMAHWRSGLALLHGPVDWLLGEGLGRLPARYARESSRHEMPADFQFGREGANGYSLLSGPPSKDILGGFYGLAQRIPIVAAASYEAEFDVRVFASTALSVAYCQKYLIYGTTCVAAEVAVNAVPGWQHIKVPLTGNELAQGSWYAPQSGVFSLSVLKAGRMVAIDNVQLIADGHPLLGNGDFSQGLARWFLSGESYFVPWHIDNLALEVLLDQGLLGAVALGWIVLVTIRRLVFGSAHRHVLAPFIAAALAGYLAVGLFSSLLDVPRVAFLFFLLVTASGLLLDDKARVS